MIKSQLGYTYGWGPFWFGREYDIRTDEWIWRLRVGPWRFKLKRPAEVDVRAGKYWFQS